MHAKLVFAVLMLVMEGVKPADSLPLEKLLIPHTPKIETKTLCLVEDVLPVDCSRHPTRMGSIKEWNSRNFIISPCQKSFPGPAGGDDSANIMRFSTYRCDAVKGKFWRDGWSWEYNSTTNFNIRCRRLTIISQFNGNFDSVFAAAVICPIACQICADLCFANLSSDDHGITSGLNGFSCLEERPDYGDGANGHKQSLKKCPETLPPGEFS